MKKLLYVCEADSGGIMEYAIRQSAALVNQRVEVHFLCEETFPKERLAAGIVVHEFPLIESPRWARGKLRTIWILALRQRQKSKRIVEIWDAGNFDAILLACFKEYFSPFWVGPLWRLAKRGVVIGTIAHDPVRDFVVGPLWWHRWCIRLGYSFVRDVFVHDETTVDFGGKKPARIRIHQIPHGPYEVAEPKIGRTEMRRRLRFNYELNTAEQSEIEHPKVVPKGEGMGTSESKVTASTTRQLGGGSLYFQRQPEWQDERERASQRSRDSGQHMAGPAGASFSNPSTIEHARDSENPSLNRSTMAPASLPATSMPPVTSVSPDVVFLAFGQIRDGKNLDLFLRAMTRLPENVKLLVAGKGDSGSSKPPEFYQKLAEELGVGDRCRWDIRKIPHEEVGDLFAACDVVLVTYSAKFRSASGVMNVAVSARKPLLAASGEGQLKKVVQEFTLGVFVEPDDLWEIVRGASKLFPSSASGVAEFVVKPNWHRYEQENSWDINVSRIVKSIMN